MVSAREEVTGERLKRGNGPTGGEEEEKGVVRPRPTGVALSAIMQLLEVFGLGELREGGRVLMIRAGADRSPALFSWTEWGRRATEKREGGHEERDNVPDSGVFLPFRSLLDAWLSCLPRHVFVLISSRRKVI